MKKYKKLFTIIIAIIIMIFGVTLYQEYIEIQERKETSKRLKQEREEAIMMGKPFLPPPDKWPSINPDRDKMVGIIENATLIVIGSVFFSLLIYTIVKYKKNKEIKNRDINILLVLLLSTVLFIRNDIRWDFECYKILTNILSSIGLVILANLSIKKSIYRWIIATILLDVFLTYIIYYLLDYYITIQMIVMCTCIILIIILIAYHIKKLINLRCNKNDKELTLKIKNKEN